VGSLGVLMSSPAKSGSGHGGSRGAPYRSPAKGGGNEGAAGLSAKLGNLLLTDKEATGLVIKGVQTAAIPRPKWAVVGKVCSSRKLVIGALEKAMQKACGLHGPAQFKDIGNNRFVVRFMLEDDWKHVMRSGP
jgi:hypothetical protein